MHVLVFPIRSYAQDYRPVCIQTTPKAAIGFPLPSVLLSLGQGNIGRFYDQSFSHHNGAIESDRGGLARKRGQGHCCVARGARRR
ncbi:MAG: hypothetical protein EBT13_09740, partial [Rhodobacteraceae bacterium]|nr:hypothetical protein [Paracoccaceae bacterium]